MLKAFKNYSLFLSTFYCWMCYCHNCCQWQYNLLTLETWETETAKWWQKLEIKHHFLFSLPFKWGKIFHIYKDYIVAFQKWFKDTCRKRESIKHRCVIRNSSSIRIGNVLFMILKESLQVMNSVSICGEKCKNNFLKVCIKWTFPFKPFIHSISGHI